MLPPIPGWTRRTRGDGAVLLGPAGTIAYRDELTPIERFASLAWPGARATRFTTTEGEHAAIASGGGRALAVVLGDRHYARLDGEAAPGCAEALATAVRAIAERVTFGLGVRPRRIWHAPPAGWTGVPRGLSSDWLAPRPPRGATRIRVFPATPARLAPDEVLAAILDEDRLAGLDPEVLERVDRPHGLLARTRVTGPAGALDRDWSLECVAGYQYSVRLETFDPAARAEARAALDAVLASIERVPQPWAIADATGAMGHWID